MAGRTLSRIISAVFAGHRLIPSESSRSLRITQHIYGSGGYHPSSSESNTHPPQYPSRLLDRRFLGTLLRHIFSSSTLGLSLRRLVVQYVLSRLHMLVYLPIIYLFHIFRDFLDPTTNRPCLDMIHRSISHFTTSSMSPIPNVSTAFDNSSDGFHFPIVLSSSKANDNLPHALNAHLSRSDFDPDFVATLLSRTNAAEDIVDIILDTGCTFSITPDRRDFIEYHPGTTGHQVQTVNGPTDLTGYGRVRWTLISEDGSLLDMILPCHHVPASNVRLLSPQDYCQHRGLDRSKDQFGGNSNYFWLNADHDRTRFQCPIDPRSNLPVALAKIPCNQGGCTTESTESIANDLPSSCPSCHRHGIVSHSVLAEANQNLTSAQKDLLLWHFRLGHMGFAHLQSLMRPRNIEDRMPHSNPPCQRPRPSTHASFQRTHPLAPASLHSVPHVKSQERSDVRPMSPPPSHLRKPCSKFRTSNQEPESPSTNMSPPCEVDWHPAGEKKVSVTSSPVERFSATTPAVSYNVIIKYRSDLQTPSSQRGRSNDQRNPVA